VQCRSFNLNEDGVYYYKKLLGMLNPGPALLHQTYANLLDELNRSAEAVPHRKLAVQLEPAGWSWQGTGNTMNKLGRWAEADAAFAEATRLDPDEARYWMNWAYSKYLRRDDAAAIEKCKQGLAVDPKFVTLWTIWGDAEKRLNHFDSALAKYGQAIKLAPRGYYAYHQSSLIYQARGEKAKAAEFAARSDQLRGHLRGDTTSAAAER
jgi:superkiller protein 3